ncbi:MAG: pyridoxine 5'-phosphate synthase [bacterium]
MKDLGSLVKRRCGDNAAMLQLGVNIDHAATLREARYRHAMTGEGVTPEPDPVAAARVCVEAGAHSITAHLREDRRHMQEDDIDRLKKELSVPLNLEMAVTEVMAVFVVQLQPQEACLVPENRREVTTEGGLNALRFEKEISACLKRLKQAGVRASLFLDPEPEQIKCAARMEAPCVELHTGRFANAASNKEREFCLRQLEETARLAHQLGLQVNAGHGLNYQNLPFLLRVPHLHTLNIGHSIISRAIIVGLRQAVEEMLALMKDYHG